VKVCVLGRGKLGRTLAAALRAADAEVELRAARGKLAFPATRGACCFVLAVPDSAIAPLAQRLAAQLAARDVVLHCAGSRGAEELRACAERGAATGAFHPLISFASRRILPPLAGATFVSDGHPRAVRQARRLCRLLGAHCLAATVLGPAYHAAAALLANGGAALGYAAVQILRDLGIEQRAGQRALGALLASVAFNLQHVGVPQALTGPVARGDAATVKRHMRALAALDPAHRRAYQRIQPLIQRCAAAQHALQAPTGERASARATTPKR
jgi:predicted short-subunit dehydrogenase-like oxidoreductase (DUF2520 family)